METVSKCVPPDITSELPFIFIDVCDVTINGISKKDNMYSFFIMY